MKNSDRMKKRFDELYMKSVAGVDPNTRAEVLQLIGFIASLPTPNIMRTLREYQNEYTETKDPQYIPGIILMFREVINRDEPEIHEMNALIDMDKFPPGIIDDLFETRSLH